MIYGIIGNYLYSVRQKRGNGKTLTMTAIAYILGHKQGMKCYFNYETSFGTKISLQDFYELFHSGNVSNSFFCISEIQNYIDSHYGISKGGVDSLIMDMALQTRKADVVLMWDTQRRKNVHLVLDQQTDYFIEPTKYHIENDGSIQYLCPFERIDRCPIPLHRHVIIAKMVIPEISSMEMWFNASIFGKLYNSDEIVRRQQE